MTRDEFLKRLKALCREANVRLQDYEQYGNDETYQGTEWAFASREHDATGHAWIVSVDDDLQQSIGRA